MKQKTPEEKKAVAFHEAEIVRMKMQNADKKSIQKKQQGKNEK